MGDRDLWRPGLRRSPLCGGEAALPAVRVYGSDVEHAKPAPEGFALAASRLGVATSACVVVEDAPAGISAAVAADCTVIGLTALLRNPLLGHCEIFCLRTPMITSGRALSRIRLQRQDHKTLEYRVGERRRASVSAR
ncbi:HAD family phosphatase [Streptomyces kronopolitis]|uniref:HAD family hydrolase n=1 Tax=Streptomyces kronopolitis TaxID=1612435 RepID=UPI0034355F1B